MSFRDPNIRAEDKTFQTFVLASSFVPFLGVIVLKKQRAADQDE